MPAGAHMSVAGGLHRAFERGREVGCRAVQIFTKNARGWKSTPLAPPDVKLFRDELEAGMAGATCAHASYLINLGAPGGPVAERSLAGIVDELQRCEVLGIPFLVLHPGAHMGAGEEAGLDRIAANLDGAHAACPGFRVRILLENAAGQGTCLGHRFEHLEGILARVHEPDRLGVCFDTCHAFAGGYDIRTSEGYEAATAEFDRRVGLDRIRIIHVNDSKKGLGCRVDRHEHIGQGEIGLEAFRCLVNDARLADVPKILETPKGDDMAEDFMNLRTLASLVGTSAVPPGKPKGRGKMPASRPAGTKRSTKQRSRAAGRRVLR
ncbi:MAG: deoxyribonuclease IV [Candidatus Wallbacteria bacterium]|nr:deoxyribonuclease IV [Candidatus Wallbacteria bacterium]